MQLRCLPRRDILCRARASARICIVPHRQNAAATPRAPLHVAHFRQGNVVDAQGFVQLPLEGQELLGLRRNEVLKDSELNAIYEQLAGTGVETGYSADALDARMEVLDFVRGEIISNKGRSREARELSVPVELLPGVLALMSEVGQCQLALDFGLELLQAPEALPAVEMRDVLLSVALANCGLASEILEGSNAQARNGISRGCGYLEAALQHLESAGQPPLAPKLATDIRQGLASLRFQGALEQLTGAIGHGKADGRKRALRIVRDAMRVQGHEGGAAGFVGVPVTAEAMETLLTVLTCEEVVNLFEWEQVARNPAAHKWLRSGVLEAVGVAHIVHGFVCRQPAYVKMGLSLVQQLPTTPDLSVVEGVCYLLLGSVNQAAAALKEAERQAGKAVGSNRMDTADGALPASRDAYRFVVASSVGSDDGLLPGLCTLTERWLSQAAFPFFRDTASAETAASLVKYFDDTRVETLLTVYDAKSGGQLAETLSEAFTSIKLGLRKAAAAGLSAASTVAAPGGEGIAGTGLAERQRLFRAVAGGVALVAALALGCMTPPGRRLLGGGDSTQVALMRQRTSLQAITVAPEDFDASVARRLLDQWQTAKAWALGAYHTTDQLGLLVSEPLLGETLDKVATLRSHGAHMRFKLTRLEVQSVRRIGNKGGPTMRVCAVLDDTADLHNDADGKAINTCRRTYDAEYVVVQGKDGIWRMISTSVTERVTK
ncbi:Protein ACCUMULATION AND REPLICATION OF CHLOROPLASTS 6, chloroplastic [Tetrabaena socialis]|uniref:Protein ACCUMULATION AND REPLICATION OF CHLOROPLASTS 6, chloroplastic n=1 Tax=Tetrabaena socialis TaxID=47790 RepID=A0A2J8AIS2_9CHLO|nr:Protein ACCUMULATION AND REPLICATION OF CHLOROPLASTS 6, chloroplastic [Tetrabaena socialis]|eukprot:PNH12420.1 Protein ACCUMULATION AND REPLICATION OF CHLOROPLASTS 6, chloroplastic [Tetrabaena socialis]